VEVQEVGEVSDLLMDLAEYLADEGVTEGPNVDTFLDDRPEEPDKVVSLIEYAGSPTPTGSNVVERSIQVSVRSSLADPNWARTKIWEIFNKLDTPVDRILDLREDDYGAERWGVLYARQSPFFLLRDQNGRVVYTFNMGITTYRD
jgi:hypothetical protein